MYTINIDHNKQHIIFTNGKNIYKLPYDSIKNNLSKIERYISTPNESYLRIDDIILTIIENNNKECRLKITFNEVIIENLSIDLFLHVLRDY